MTRLLLDEPPLLVMPSLAKAVGLEGAIVLQQLHYWASKAQPRDGRPWVYNTIAQWAEQFPFWSERTMRRILAELKSSGLVDVAEFNAHRGDRTPFYAINHARLAELEGCGPSANAGQTMRPERADGPAKLAASYIEQETTTETTAERKSKTLAPSASRATPAAPPVVAEPAVIDLPTCRKGEAYGVTAAEVRQFAELYPGVDVPAQLRAMKGWLLTNQTKRKTARGMPAFINSWLAKEQNRGSANAQHQPTGRSGRRLSASEEIEAARIAAGVEQRFDLIG
jgi:hypothetical protein